MSIALATAYHDPKDRMYEQIAAELPALTRLFGGIALIHSAASPQRSLDLLKNAGALVQREASDQAKGASGLGVVRRTAVALALQTDADFILYFDFDSILHWSERYPDELAATLKASEGYDFSVVGRTQHALDSHPRPQLQTELLVNEVFTRLTGHDWDVMRSGRGMSRRAAELIVAQSIDVAISTDVSWPLLVIQAGGFTMGEFRVDGTEFETPDRYAPEVAAAGGVDAWLAQYDRDPRQWAHRLALARMHMEAMIPFANR